MEDFREKSLKEYLIIKHREIGRRVYVSLYGGKYRSKNGKYGEGRRAVKTLVGFIIEHIKGFRVAIS